RCTRWPPGSRRGCRPRSRSAVRPYFGEGLFGLTITLSLGLRVVNAAAGRPGRTPDPMRDQPRAVIWDVDGTLVDTAELHFAAWLRTATEMGRPFSRDNFASTFGRRNPEIIRFLFQQDFTDTEVLDIGERKETYYRG